MQGADRLVQRLNELRKIKEDVLAEIEDTATNIEINAIRDAPVSIGQTISKIATNGGYGFKINVGAGKIGAYIEFGTGPYAAQLVPTLPQEWQNVARTFYVNGQGTLRAAPYLYPNYLRFTTGLKERIQVILDRYTG